MLFLLLTLYWDERVVVFPPYSLILRREGREDWFLNWPCTERRGSLFFILNLYRDEKVVVLPYDWDERVVRIDFWTDLVLRREGHCSSFWPCTKTRDSLFFFMTLNWDERVSRIDFWTKMRGSLFFILTCTETRGSLFLLMTLCRDKRVARIDFWTDLVLSRDGRCSSFWPYIKTRGSWILD